MQLLASLTRARPRARLVLLLAWGLIAGCVGLASRMEPPLLSIASLNLAGASLFEQRYGLSVRIRNPNPFDLPIEAMRYDLEINGRPFASGLSNAPVVVPGYGTRLVQMEAISTLPSFLRQLGALGTSPTFDYRLRGRLYLADGSTLPFNYRGDTTLTR